MNKQEQIDIVRRMIADGVVTQEQAAKYFPELAESENEKILKAIYQYLYNVRHNIGQLTPYTDEFDRWIAWLEYRTMSKAEKFIREHTNTCSNVIIDYQVVYNGVPQAIYKEWLTPDQAREAVEIAREEIYEWLRVNLCDYFDAPRGDYDMCLDDLKQAMKDE